MNPNFFNQGGMQMEQKQFFKQMVDFNRMAFDNSFKAVMMFQEQMEKMASAMLVQSSLLPEEGKKAVDEWLKTYKRGREDFKKVVDEGFERIVSFLSSQGTDPQAV